MPAPPRELAPSSPASQDAALAVAQLRLARRSRLRAALSLAALELSSLLPVGLVALFHAYGDAPVPAALRWVMALVTVTITAAIFGTLLLLPRYLRLLLRTLAALALAPYRLLRRLAERRLEQQLLTHGHVPPQAHRGRWLRARALDRLTALEPSLVLDDGTLRPLTVVPPGACEPCGARLVAVGPGLRHCEHCGHERYDPLPVRSDAMLAAEAALRSTASAAADELPRVPTSAALFRRTLDPSIREGLLVSSLASATLVAAVLLAWILQALGASLAFMPAGMVVLTGMLIGFFGLLALGWHGFRWMRARLAFAPGAAAYDQALRHELLRVVAHQGQITVPALAQHLGISRAWLDELVLHLQRVRGLPVHHDRERDRLVSVYAGLVGDTRCPACGGQAAPGPNSRLICGFCAHASAAPTPFPSGAPLPPELVATEPAVSLCLHPHEGPYAAGDPVHGEAVVRCGTPRRCEDVVVRLWWGAFGPQGATDHTVVDEEAVFHRRGELHGEHRFPFTFALPLEPVSFRGEVVRLTWSLTARVRWPGDEPDLRERKVLTVVPTLATADEPVRALGRIARTLGRRRRWDATITGLVMAMVVAFLVFAAAVSVLLVLGGLAWALSGQGVVRGLAAAGFGFLVGVGLYATVQSSLAYALRQLTLGRLGVCVRGVPGSLRVGERFTAELRLPSSRRALDGLRYELRAVESAARQEQKTVRGSTITTTRWTASTRTLARGELPLPSGRRSSLELTLPPDTPPTLLLETRRVEVELRVMAEASPDTATCTVPLLVLPRRVPEEGRSAPTA